MRAPAYPSARQTLRLKPGGLIVFPPRFLKHAGWHVGDTLLLSVEGGRISVMRLPDERTWRIDRLRRRSGTRPRSLETAQIFSGQAADETGDARCRSR